MLPGSISGLELNGIDLADWPLSSCWLLAADDTTIELAMNLFGTTFGMVFWGSSIMKAHLCGGAAKKSGVLI